MSRRARYMYGSALPKGETGQVDTGLGKTIPRAGENGLLAPTLVIKEDGPFRIDGVNLEITALVVPGTEAPAEFVLYFPQFKALCAAEIANNTLHNLYTLRGAQVRDAMQWWKGLDRCIAAFGKEVEVVFIQHHFPKWGNANINEYLRKQRNAYKFIHDRTLFLANQGYTMLEVGEMVQFPPGLDKEWSIRGYYGSVNHDAKAVYQRYLGFYDSNPSTLHQLPPEPAAKKYVEYMGGADAVIAKAKQDFEKGEYRWVAQALNHVVFADPENKAAKALLADTLEQLGYQTECGTWRNEYLAGAYELRHGNDRQVFASTASPETMKAMTVEMLLDFAGVSLDVDKVVGKTLIVHWSLPDIAEKYWISLEDSVLIHRHVEEFEGKADVSITMDRAVLNKLLTKQTTLEAELQAKRIIPVGNIEALKDALTCLVSFAPNFDIVTP